MCTFRFGLALLDAVLCRDPRLFGCLALEVAVRGPEDVAGLGRVPLDV